METRFEAAVGKCLQKRKSGADLATNEHAAEAIQALCEDEGQLFRLLTKAGDSIWSNSSALPRRAGTILLCHLTASIDEAVYVRALEANQKEFARWVESVVAQCSDWHSVSVGLIDLITLTFKLAKNYMSSTLIDPPAWLLRPDVESSSFRNRPIDNGKTLSDEIVDITEVPSAHVEGSSSHPGLLLSQFLLSSESLVPLSVVATSSIFIFVFGPSYGESVRTSIYTAMDVSLDLFAADLATFIGPRLVSEICYQLIDELRPCELTRCFKLITKAYKLMPQCFIEEDSLPSAPVVPSRGHHGDSADCSLRHKENTSLNVSDERSAFHHARLLTEFLKAYFPICSQILSRKCTEFSTSERQELSSAACEVWCIWPERMLLALVDIALDKLAIAADADSLLEIEEIIKVLIYAIYQASPNILNYFLVPTVELAKLVLMDGGGSFQLDTAFQSLLISTVRASLQNCISLILDSNDETAVELRSTEILEIFAAFNTDQPSTDQLDWTRPICQTLGLLDNMRYLLYRSVASGIPTTPHIGTRCFLGARTILQAISQASLIPAVASWIVFSPSFVEEALNDMEFIGEGVTIQQAVTRLECVADLLDCIMLYVSRWCESITSLSGKKFIKKLAGLVVAGAKQPNVLMRFQAYLNASVEEVMGPLKRIVSGLILLGQLSEESTQNSLDEIRCNWGFTRALQAVSMFYQEEFSLSVSHWANNLLSELSIIPQDEQSIVKQESACSHSILGPILRRQIEDELSTGLKGVPRGGLLCFGCAALCSSVSRTQSALDPNDFSDDVLVWSIKLGLKNQKRQRKPLNEETLLFLLLRSLLQWDDLSDETADERAFICKSLRQCMESLYNEIDEVDHRERFVNSIANLFTEVTKNQVACNEAILSVLPPKLITAVFSVSVPLESAATELKEVLFPLLDYGPNLTHLTFMQLARTRIKGHAADSLEGCILDTTTMSPLGTLKACRVLGLLTLLGEADEKRAGCILQKLHESSIGEELCVVVALGSFEFELASGLPQMQLVADDCHGHAFFVEVRAALRKLYERASCDSASVMSVNKKLALSLLLTKDIAATAMDLEEERDANGLRLTLGIWTEYIEKQMASCEDEQQVDPICDIQSFVSWHTENMKRFSHFEKLAVCRIMCRSLDWVGRLRERRCSSSVNDDHLEFLEHRLIPFLAKVADAVSTYITCVDSARSVRAYASVYRVTAHVLLSEAKSEANVLAKRKAMLEAVAAAG